MVWQILFFCGSPLLGSMLLEQVVVLVGLHLLLGLEGAFALAEPGLLPHSGCWPTLLPQQLSQGCDAFPCLHRVRYWLMAVFSNLLQLTTAEAFIR